MSKTKKKPTHIRHKFQCFQERIDNISVDVIKKSSKYHYDPGESRSFFSESLRELYDLNIDSLKILRHDLSEFALDLTQVVYHKEKIIQELCDRLKNPTHIIATHVLNLVSSLARDLQGELYESFEELFTVISNCVKQFHQDTEVLEQCFSTLAYLIYYVKDKAKSNMEKIVRIAEPLLLSTKQYIQHFMAESLAFLIRKVSDHRQLFDFLFQTYSDRPEMTSACGHIIAETMRGVRLADGGGKLHSISDRLLTVLIRSMSDQENGSGIGLMIKDSLRQAYSVLMAHCIARHAVRLWQLPLAALKDKPSDEVFESLCELLTCVLEFRGGRLITRDCAEELYKVLIQVINRVNLTNMRRLMTSLIIYSPSAPQRLQFMRQFFDDKKIPFLLKVSFVKESLEQKDENVFSLILMNVLPMCTKISKFSTSERALLLEMLTKIAESSSDEEDTEKILDFSKLPNPMALSEYLASLLSDHEEADDTVKMCLELMFHIKPLSENKLIPLIPGLVSSFAPAKKLLEDSDISEDRMRLILALTRIVVRVDGVDADTLPLVRLLRRFRAVCDRNEEISSLVFAVMTLDLHTARWSPLSFTPPQKVLQGAVDQLSLLLQSPDHKMRLHSLHCLLRLYPAISNLNSSSLESVQFVLERGVALESVHPVGLHNFRDAVRLTEFLSGSHVCRRPRPSEDDEADEVKDEGESEAAVVISCRFLLGRLLINFKDVWNSTVITLASLADCCPNRFWEEFLPMLKSQTAKCAGAEEKHDAESFLSQLWRTVAAVNLQKMNLEIRRELSDLLCEFSEKKYNVHKNGKNIKQFVEILTLFSKFDNLSHMDVDHRLEQLFQSLLCDRHEEVQKAAFVCIGTYHRKKVRPYSEAILGILSKVGLQTGLLTFKLNEEKTVLPNHRKLVSEVLLRILYGKLQHRAGDRNRAMMIFAYLGECCNEREINYFFALVFGKFLALILSQLEHREDAVRLEEMVTSHARDLSRGLNARTAGTMQGTCRTLYLLLDSMYFERLMGHAPLVLQLIVTFVATVSHYRETRMSTTARTEDPMDVECDAEEEEPSASACIRFSQFRGLRQASSDLLLQFCASFPTYEWTEAELCVLRAVAVTPQLSRMANEGLNNPSLCLRLLHLWGSSPKLLHMLCSEKKEDGPVGAVVKLLTHPKAASSVVALSLSLVRNLVEREDLQPQGLALTRPHFPALVLYLTRRAAALRTSGRQKAVDLTRELKLLSSLAPHIESGDVKLQILDSLVLHLWRHNRQCQAVRLNVRGKSKRRQEAAEGENQFEEAEVALLGTIEALFVSCTAEGGQGDALYSLFCKVLTLFGSCTERATRQQLCRFIGAVVDSGFDRIPRTLSQLAADLNRWDTRRVEDVDYSSREEAYKRAASVKLAGEPDGTLVHLLTAHNAVHDILAVSDPGLRAFAVSYVQSLVDVATEAGVESPPFRLLILDLIWPFVKMGLKMSAAPGSDTLRLQDILRLVERLGRSGHPRLLEISKIADLAAPNEEVEMDAEEAEEEEEMPVKLSMWDGLCSFNVGRNTHALRVLGRQLRRPDIVLSVEILRDFLLHLVWHFLQRRAAVRPSSRHLSTAEERETQRLHNLGEVASGVLEHLAARLPWPAYRGLLAKALSDLEKASGGDAAVSGVEKARNRMHVNVIVKILDAYHFDSATMEDPSASPIANGEMAETTEDPSASPIANGEADEVMEVDENEENDDAASDSTSLQFLQRIVLPKLEKQISRRRTLEEKHKLAQKSPVVEHESLEVPVALAVVKLIKLLPTQIMETKLRKIFYRVCEFLRSQRFSTRVEAGSTLVDMLVSLGPQFFHFMLKEMALCLSRGFQRHVLVLTVHHLIHGMENAQQLTSGCFSNGALSQVQDLCYDDLFGELSEEKKVEAIAKKLPEAKKSKAVDILYRLVRYLNPDQLQSFINRLKEESFKLRKKEPLKRFQNILTKLQGKDAILSNTAVTSQTLLIITHRLLSDTLPHLHSSESQQLLAKRKAGADHREEEASENPWDARPDALIIEAEPKQAKPVDLKVSKTNAHLLVDFGLRLIVQVVKTFHISGDNPNHEEAALVDPFVPIVIDCLESKHNRVISAALRCLHWFQQQNISVLPSMRSQGLAASKAVFKLLNARGGFGASEESVELLTTLFKVVAGIMKESEAVTGGDMKLLYDLVHMELMAMRSGSSSAFRISTTFSLLRALIHRERNRERPLAVDNVETFSTHGHASFSDIIRLLREVCIANEMEHVREQARQCLASHFASQRIGWGEIERHMEFFLHQLRFPVSSGRASALLLITAMCRALPPTVSLRRLPRLELFFAKLAVEMEHDAVLGSAVDLADHFEEALRALVSAISGRGAQPERALSVWGMVRGMAGAEKPSVRLAGLRMTAAFLEAEREEEVAAAALQAGESTLAEMDAAPAEEVSGSADLALSDRTVRTVIELLDRTHASSLETLNLFERLLLYRAPEVREAATQRFADLLADPHHPLAHPYFAQDRENSSPLANLVYKLFDQLKSADVTEAWCDLIVKSLVRVAACCGTEERLTRPLTLDWLFHRWNREAVFETQHMRKSTIRRCAALKFVAAVVMKVKETQDLLGHIARLIGRERRQCGRHTDETLKTLIEDTFSLLSNHFGSQLVSALAEEEKRKKEMKRKKEEQTAELAVIDSSAFAAKKIMKNRASVTKKRKLK